MEKNYTIEGKVKILKDKFMWIAFVNLIGSTIFYHLSYQFGIVGLLVFCFLVYVIVIPSITTAMLRLRVTLAINRTRQDMIGVLNCMIRAEKLNKKKQRKLYLNYLDLLVKKMDNLVDIMTKRRKALELAQNFKFNTVLQIAELEQIAQSYEKKKIFLNK
jgi:hypothetical protein